MRCAAALATYACSNATGTTCTKVAVTIPAINANATCTASELVVLLKSEYDILNTGVITATSSNTSQNTTIQTLTDGLNSANSAIVALQGGGSGGSTPNPEILAAQSALFGVILVAAVVIWGSKKIYNLFHAGSHE